MIYHTPQGETSHFHIGGYRAIRINMDTNEIFRKNLLDARHEAGISAAELSRKAGLNGRAVKDIEEGRAQSPKISTVVALANALGKEPGEMMGLGPRSRLITELDEFLSQYNEVEQSRLLAALSAIPPKPSE